MGPATGPAAGPAAGLATEDRMAKLIVTRHGAVAGNHFIDEAAFAIGAAEGNDLRLDGAGVSRDHARIVTIGNDSILEDLGSTNGTLVNGRPVTRHILQHDDVIEIADWQIRYRSHKVKEGAPFDRTLVTQAIVPEGLEPTEPVGVHVKVTAALGRPWRAGDPVGVMKALDGPHAGQEIELLRILRTFGVPGKQVVVVNRRPQGWFVTHVEGHRPARLNNRPIGPEPLPLKPDDVLEVAGRRMRFLLR